MKLLLTFIILNVLNVIIQTIKSLVTMKGKPISAALVNAIAYGLYTIVLIYMVCDLPIYQKAFIVALCNLIGVYIVKIIEVKSRKDKLWKIELTSNFNDKEFDKILNDKKLPYLKIPTSEINIYVYNIYCKSKEESSEVKRLAKNYEAKYFVIESQN